MRPDPAATPFFAFGHRAVAVLRGDLALRDPESALERESGDLPKQAGFADSRFAGHQQQLAVLAEHLAEAHERGRDLRLVGELVEVTAQELGELAPALGAHVEPVERAPRGVVPFVADLFAPKARHV